MTKEVGKKPLPSSQSDADKPGKVAPKMRKKKQQGDFWINLSIGLFISACLLVLGFELLLKIVR
ncbi:hypothetical protein [Alishewanella jeotgali]|uniref:Uncharacterized protein n=1 Tax=Alishewanella jeotgali KCTC 22429 TaxID=1129374 RepID=H3ZAQ1_9ALTE|nr:hypothetical protein [Alishewanella jeotgali]EHR42015.1 hypothetical protein AJE_02021 [Alishewanella jeotgali KCTC 22429]